MQSDRSVGLNQGADHPVLTQDTDNQDETITIVPNNHITEDAGGLSTVPPAPACNKLVTLSHNRKSSHMCLLR